eukprot:scaffold40590_cov178-Skeletonema_dohrnii-CCMP3373.AAC.1
MQTCRKSSASTKHVVCPSLLQVAAYEIRFVAATSHRLNIGNEIVPHTFRAQFKGEVGILLAYAYAALDSTIAKRIIIATRVLRRNSSRTLHSETSPLISTLSQICHCYCIIT